jgi:pyrroline-5-carboxylate reductase
MYGFEMGKSERREDAPVSSIGFVGTGAITEALVRGLLARPAFASRVVLSPRSADVAARLSVDFCEVVVAGDNQDVVDRSDIVFLAVRPQIVEEVVRNVNFASSQCVVSIVAATDRERLLDWIKADVHLVQAIPLPFVRERNGVTAIYPPDATIARLFDTLGTAVECTSRKEYDMLAAASALMSTYFGIMEFVSTWLETEGLDREKSRTYIASLFASLAQQALASDGNAFDRLSDEFATKGGLNEQVLADFDRLGGRNALTTALKRVLDRIEGRT